MKFKHAQSCLGVICFLIAVNCGGGFELLDMFKSATDITGGVAKQVFKKIPTPEALFDMSKQVVAGYPFEIVSSSINKICSAALATESVTPRYLPDINKMQFQLKSGCKNFSFPLLKANEMWTSPHFNRNKKVVILATGWTTTVNESDAIKSFAKAYECRGDVNFVAVDAASFVDTLYSWSAFNTEELGRNIAEGIRQLINIVPVKDIHLIGHSLGAHIMGSAGRNFELLTGKTISRITGLDPAKPCFNEGEVLSGLTRGDADFVDVIHSNPGVLGKRDSLGDVDFYPGGLDPLPAGCLTVTCAHGRAWEYFVETVYDGNAFNFIGTRCNSLTNLREQKCSTKMVPMGYATPSDAKGNFFLEINGEAPYGKNGIKSSSMQYAECGRCKESLSGFF